MHFLFLKNFGSFFVASCFLIFLIGYSLHLYNSGESIVNSETATVARGDVTEKITMSGKVEAKNIARLTFPKVGTIQYVYKDEGDTVVEGEVIASLVQNSAISDYTAAIENVKYYEASKQELLRGPEDSKRVLSATNVAIAEKELTRIEEAQARLVEKAREDLLSVDIVAYPVNTATSDIPPVITGSYFCAQEGDYVISIYPSASISGYSYRLSGLESGMADAFTEAAGALGTCGLYIEFDATEHYRSENWIVSIPNKRSSTYSERFNAYKIALQQQSNTVSAAKQALELARYTELNANDHPRNEIVSKIDANIAEARALVLAKEGAIADYTIRAPFNGTVTENNLKIGETATLERTVTVLQENEFEFKIRIPEADITKVNLRDTVHILFDAQPHDTILGTIDYIASNATEISGVAYYEARITVLSKPEWMRPGLNADVYVITKQKKDVLTLPKRFIIEENKDSYVLVRKNLEVIKTPIEIGLVGNDGYVEVLNLDEGTEVIASP